MPQTLPPSGNFSKTYWFIVCTTLIAMGYSIALTFLPIPESNKPFAYLIVGVFLGTVLGSNFSFLLGGTPTAPLHPPINTSPGTTTAEISATITKDEPNNEVTNTNK
jgi:hypothetical protein